MFYFICYFRGRNGKKSAETVIQWDEALLHKEDTGHLKNITAHGGLRVINLFRGKAKFSVTETSTPSKLWPQPQTGLVKSAPEPGHRARFLLSFWRASGKALD